MNTSVNGQGSGAGETPPHAIYKTPEEMAEAFAAGVIDRARAAIAARGAFTFCLTGGSTPRALYRRLAQADCRGALDWGRAKIFFGDERCVPPDHADSNYRMAREAWLDDSGIPAGRIFRMRGEAADLLRSATEYESTLRREAPPNPALRGGYPAFDLLLLGMGADGHVASLFPGSAALDEKIACCVLNAVPQLATRRLTLTFTALNAARETWLLVTGANKAARVAQALGGGDPRGMLPVSRVKPAAGRLEWWLDEPAAADWLAGARHTPRQA